MLEIKQFETKFFAPLSKLLVDNKEGLSILKMFYARLENILKIANADHIHFHETHKDLKKVLEQLQVIHVLLQCDDKNDKVKLRAIKKIVDCHLNH